MTQSVSEFIASKTVDKTISSRASCLRESQIPTSFITQPCLLVLPHFILSL